LLAVEGGQLDALGTKQKPEGRSGFFGPTVNVTDFKAALSILKARLQLLRASEQESYTVSQISS